MLAVRKYIENTAVMAQEFICFDINKIEEYKAIFNKYKEKGVIIKDTEFDDDVWVVNDGVHISRIRFEFNEIKYISYQKPNENNINYNEFIVSIKAFMLYSLTGSGIRTIRENLNYIKKLFNKTEYLCVNNFDKLINENSNKFWILTPFLIHYLSFNEDFKYDEELIEDIKEHYNLKNAERARQRENGVEYRRLLPLYTTMFKFDEIINNFIDFSEGDLRETFFPIILWWKITTLIPLRATEFSITPIDCVGYNKKYARNTLTVNRTIAKGSLDKGLHTFEEKYKSYEFPITQEVVDLINEYKSIVDKYDFDENFYGSSKIKTSNRRKYLLSTRSYFKNMRLGPKKQGAKVYLERTLNPEIFTNSAFNKLIMRFMEEIVWGQYNIPIVEKKRLYAKLDAYDDIDDVDEDASMQSINMMDTRHFAIMNLVHLGYSASTIQKIVGHSKISTSYAYTDHQEVFTDCYVVSVAKRKAFEKNSKSINTILNVSFDSLFGEYNSSGHRRFKALKQKKSFNEDITPIILDEGICTYTKDDMIPCKMLLGNHRRCKFFVPDKTKLNVIEDELNILSNEISAEIKTMQYMIENQKRIRAFDNKYFASINRIRVLENQKSDIIADYIINGVD